MSVVYSQPLAPPPPHPPVCLLPPGTNVVSVHHQALTTPPPHHPSAYIHQGVMLCTSVIIYLYYYSHLVYIVFQFLLCFPFQLGCHGDFCHTTRMPPSVYMELLELVRPLITYKDTNRRKAITAEERLSLTIRYLSRGVYSKLSVCIID